MLELIVRPRARRDLKEIWSYTVQQWGEAQADQYLYDLDREIQAAEVSRAGIAFRSCPGGLPAAASETSPGLLSP